MEVTTSFQHFKYGIEIRIESVNKDSSHSWVRISYGTVKYVIDSIEEENSEIPADPQEEQTPQTSTSVVAARSKAKAKPQPREFAGTTATIPIHQRRWIDIEPSKQDLASYDLSKKVINLLRHNQTVQREEDGAIEFYKIKCIYETIILKYRIGPMIDGKLVWLQAEDPISIALIIWDQLFISVFFKDILVAASLILQDKCVDWNWNIPLHLPCWVHIQSSLYYQQWIDTWRSEFEQKTNGVLLAC